MSGAERAEDAAAANPTATTAVTAAGAVRRKSAWLFSARIDLAAFGGSAALALGALVLGAWTGALDGATPGWAFVPAVLLVDVAHVWATGFRVYLDGAELRRRPVLYLGAPIVALALALVLSLAGERGFWRGLAYLAVIHFVRQQWGWVALYRARAGERDRLGRYVDAAAVYAATLWPVLWWHGHLPRRFSWFLDGDFVALPALLARVTLPLYLAALGAYAVLAARRWLVGRGTPGKDLVVATTAACWYAGIVAMDSDYAFT